MRLVLLLICLLTVGYGRAQPAIDKQLVLLTRVIQKNHYNPKPVNDSFSTQVFDRVLKDLDRVSLYFTQKEIKSLEAYRYKIDDEMMGKSTGFATQLAALYKERLQKALLVINRSLQQPFNFDVAGNLYKGKNSPYPADENAFEKRLQDYFKMRVLEFIAEAAEEDSTALTKTLLQQAEPAARKKVLERSKGRIEKFLNDGFQQKVNDSYLEAVASNFDPHTNFFEPEQQKEFAESLSSEAYKFGFSFVKDDNSKYRIESLTPGGAAWSSGSIHKNDEVVSIQPDKDSIVRMDDANAEQMLQELDKASLQKITITVKSADGVLKSVALQKQKQQNEENTVKGFVLNGPVKTGYFALPSFYTEWDANGGSSCANDVAKEIVKLKKENIAGLILDLRYNGGGSLQEALELLGIFVDVGPGCIIKDQSGKNFVLKDPNRGTIYDGPLIIMINGQSASASELVAGTLQDYQRALIVGSNSFGKATMQAIYPLDTLSTNAEGDFAKLYGFVKVTNGKLFRITGKTAQLNGVRPDVVLPDAFELAEYTERSLENALPSDTVVKKLVYSPSPGYKTSALVTNSQARIINDPYFKPLAQLIKKAKTSSVADNVPLQWQDFLKWRQTISLQQLPTNVKAPTYIIQSTSFDAGLEKLAGYLQEMDDYVKTEIKADRYIEEAYQIMNDITKTP